jgi:hypothetical protein
MLWSSLLLKLKLDVEFKKHTGWGVLQHSLTKSDILVHSLANVSFEKLQLSNKPHFLCSFTTLFLSLFSPPFLYLLFSFILSLYLSSFSNPPYFLVLLRTQPARERLCVFQASDSGYPWTIQNFVSFSASPDMYFIIELKNSFWLLLRSSRDTVETLCTTYGKTSDTFWRGNYTYFESISFDIKRENNTGRGQKSYFSLRWPLLRELESNLRLYDNYTFFWGWSINSSKTKIDLNYI